MRNVLLSFCLIAVTSAEAEYVDRCLELEKLGVSNTVLQLEGCLRVEMDNSPETKSCAELSELNLADSALRLYGCIDRGREHLFPQNRPEHYPGSYGSDVCVLDTTSGVDKGYIYLRLDDVEINNPLLRLSSRARVIDLHRKKKDEFGAEYSLVRVVRNEYSEGQLPLVPNGTIGWILTGVFKCYQH